MVKLVYKLAETEMDLKKIKIFK